MAEKHKEFNPLAVNILRLQNYTNYFDLAEIVMFEWFVIKASSFKNQHEFYYSIRRIASETNIRKAQLTTIIKRFEKSGIISVEKKGMPKCSYFQVNKENIISLLPQIYQFAENGKLLTENSKLLSYFGKLLPENSKHKGTYKEPTKGTLKENSEEDLSMVDEVSSTVNTNSFFDGVPLSEKQGKASAVAELKRQKETKRGEQAKKTEINRLKNLLNRHYAERVKKYNSERVDGDPHKVVTKLPFLLRNEEALYELGQQYGHEEIENSFIAYIDSVLSGETDVTKIVTYFLSRKPETRDYDVFHTFLNKFILDYSITPETDDW